MICEQCEKKDTCEVYQQVKEIKTMNLECEKFESNQEG